MLKGGLVNFRNSASLIILSKIPQPDFTFDYKVLLFGRHEKASFMPKASVFPGGMCETADESPLWLKHFSTFGIQADRLKELVPLQGLPRPQIFVPARKDSLDKEISLRITAIRETFEEVGIMLCRDRDSLDDCSKYGEFRANFDRELWQRVVHDDPAKFLTLCQELQVVPDLWSLHEWAVWLTPSTFKRRFQTVFFLAALQQMPSLLTEQSEVGVGEWKTPRDYLLDFQAKKIMLPPPQFYEISRLMNIRKLSQVKDFAFGRAMNGTIVTLPVQYRCTDGMVALMPGDDMYPVDPNAANDFIATNVTMEEFRSGAEKLHRAEYINMNEGLLFLNFPLPDRHLSPMNLNVRNI